jgi:hypothetical protein
VLGGCFFALLGRAGLRLRVVVVCAGSIGQSTLSGVHNRRVGSFLGQIKAPRILWPIMDEWGLVFLLQPDDFPVGLALTLLPLFW